MNSPSSRRSPIPLVTKNHLRDDVFFAPALAADAPPKKNAMPIGMTVRRISKAHSAKGGLARMSGMSGFSGRKRTTESQRTQREETQRIHVSNRTNHPVAV